jgi:molybdopterin-guanine dinucleotide biosynthesis protein A
MGQDKALIPWRNRTLLDHMTDLLSGACDSVRVVGRGLLPDQIPGQGPLGGIATALAVTGTARNLIVGVDLPLITPSFIEWLARRTLASPRPITVCQIGSRYPICFGIDRSLAGAAQERIQTGRLALREFIDASDPEIVPEDELETLGFSLSMFLNLNTPDDLEEIRGQTPIS